MQNPWGTSVSLRTSSLWEGFPSFKSPCHRLLRHPFLFLPRSPLWGEPASAEPCQARAAPTQETPGHRGQRAADSKGASAFLGLALHFPPTES